MSKRRPDHEVIWEWWKTRTKDEKDEAISILEVLTDNDSRSRIWLQVMIGSYGSAYVAKVIELFETGAFQSSDVTEDIE